MDEEFVSPEELISQILSEIVDQLENGISNSSGVSSGGERVSERGVRLDPLTGKIVTEGGTIPDTDITGVNFSDTPLGGTVAQSGNTSVNPEINFNDLTKPGTNIPTELLDRRDIQKNIGLLEKLFNLFGGVANIPNGALVAGSSAVNLPGAPSSLGIGLNAAATGGKVFNDSLTTASDAIGNANAVYQQQNQQPLK